ncbi:MAG: glycosyltransferase family 4 protein [Solirubrobacteraceae bacterium]
MRSRIGGDGEAAGRLVVGLVQTRRYPSTDRYREAIARGFAERDIQVLECFPEPRARGAAFGLSRTKDYARRWIREPIAVRRLPADVFHLVDDLGPLTRMTPPERTLVTCHDLILLLAAEGSIPYDGPSWYIRRFRWGAAGMRRVAGVVCFSEATRRDILRLSDVEPARVHVIPHGVDERFVPLPARRQQLRQELAMTGSHVILNVGTEAFYKNIRATLTTLRILREAGSDAVLVRAGGQLGPVERAERTRLGLDAAVIDLGRVTDQRLVELYNAADVLLFPSSAEGFGFPVLEAMACGTPVVASDIPALREIGGNTVSYAPADDPRALAAAVRSVLEAPERRAVAGELARARAREFRWSRAVDAHEALYRDVAARAASSTGHRGGGRDHTAERGVSLPSVPSPRPGSVRRRSARRL